MISVMAGVAHDPTINWWQSKSPSLAEGLSKTDNINDNATTDDVLAAANEAVFDERIDVAFIALLFAIMLLTSYVPFSFCPSPSQTKVEF